MNKVILTLFMFLFSMTSIAQTTETKYYNSKYKEVSEKKAKYVKTTTKNNDGSKTMNVMNLRTGHETKETYKEYEPYGIWNSGGQKRDYNFRLVYTNDECTNANLAIKKNHYFEDNDTVAYKAPRISTEVDFFQFMCKNMRYPNPAKENGIQGTVQAQFTITKEGTVKNISITKGVHVTLDKEYVRVIRKMKFNIPPMINGQPAEICVSAPCVFRLE